MTVPEQRGLYPNPSSQKTWTDGVGRKWRRRGDVARGVSPKRVRHLLGRSDVALATWSAGVVEWFEPPNVKRSAADALYAAATSPHDVVPSEWRSENGISILMLEHLC